MNSAPASGVTELLLLPNGQILVHNLTPPMAALLRQLDPTDLAMAQRAGGKLAGNENPAVAKPANSGDGLLPPTG